MTPSRAMTTVSAMLVATACGAAPDGREIDAASLRAVLDSMHAAHAAAYQREDVDELLTIYTEDAVIRPNHAEPVTGRDAIRSLLTGWFAALNFQSLTYTTDDLYVHGDTAYAIGRTEATVAAGQSPPMTDRGSYMVMFVRDANGNWRSHRGVFNSSLPLPGQ